MGDILVPGYKTFLTNKCSTLKSEYQTLVEQYPAMNTQLKRLLKVRGDIEEMAGHTAASDGESAEWAAIVNTAEERGASY
jgi:hypothetical protein